MPVCMRIWRAVGVTALGVLAASPAGTTAGLGEVVAFSRWQNGSAQIYLVDPDGTGLRRVTRPGRWEDSHPGWSPDGTQIVFGRRGATGWRLFVTGLNGDTRALTTAPDSLANHPDWSPDGRWIVFERLPRDRSEKVGSQQLYVVRQDGSGLRQLTSFSRFRGGAGGAHWSADGRRVVFWGQSVAGDSFRPDAYVMRADGTGIRRVIADARDPVWSPDGTKIAFSRRGEIFIANANGHGQRRLTRSTYSDSSPDWSPDGTRIAFSSLHRWKGEVSVMGADGRGLREITHGGADVESSAVSSGPAWRP